MLQAQVLKERRSSPDAQCIQSKENKESFSRNGIMMLPCQCMEKNDTPKIETNKTTGRCQRLDLSVVDQLKVVHVGHVAISRPVVLGHKLVFLDQLLRLLGLILLHRPGDSRGEDAVSRRIIGV